MPGARQFGRYLLVEKLAQGGMAEIYRAQAQGFGGFQKPVIVKTILPCLSADERFVKQFVNEAKLSSMLSHSNIVQVFDFGRIGADYFIVMEYVDGTDLRSVVRGCRAKNVWMPVDLALHVAMRVLKGLGAVHGRRDAALQPLGLVHRDVSPQNVLVSRVGEVKLTDFGIARARGERAGGEVQGNYGYMPPEQATGEPLDARADLYALGMVLYELVTLQNPFADRDLQEVLRRIRESKVAPPSRINPAVPAGLDAILLKALEKEPESRFATAEEFGEALGRHLFPFDADRLQSSLAAFLPSVVILPPPAAAVDPAEPPRRIVRDAANMARIRLDAEPPDVEVFLDDSPITVGSPVEIQTSARVQHRLRLRRDGFTDFNTMFVLDPSEVRQLRIELARARR